MEIAVAVIKSSMEGSSKTITMLNIYVTDINFSLLVNCFLFVCFLFKENLSIYPRLSWNSLADTGLKFMILISQPLEC